MRKIKFARINCENQKLSKTLKQGWFSFRSNHEIFDEMNISMNYTCNIIV